MVVLRDIHFTSESVDSIEEKYYLDIHLPAGTYGKHQQNGQQFEYGADEVEDETYNEISPESQETREVRTLKRKRPFVIFIHGGGWRRGGKQVWPHYLYHDTNLLVAAATRFFNLFDNVGEVLVHNGIGCAVVSYPLSDLGMPHVLLEQLLSYVASCLFMLLLIAPLATVTYLLALVFHSGHTPFWVPLAEKNAPVGHIIYVCALSVVTVTNLTMMVLQTIKSSKFQMTSFEAALTWIISILALAIPGWNKLALFSITSFILIQLATLRRRIARSSVSYVNQASVVADAVKWVKRFGETTDTFDVSQLYLMGHSAGGHLASLVSLDDGFLKQSGCSIRDIKGVISLSGVYDLHCLDSKFLKSLYLSPTFGSNSETWVSASPHHILKSGTHTPPPFLLLGAQRDLHLKEQTERFVEKLSECGILYDYRVIRGTNHFTIVSHLHKQFGEKAIIEHCLEFIFDGR